MDRRNFLKSMGALAAAATCMPSFAAITEPNKYAESLRLLDACRGITDPKQVAGTFDQLLTHLRKNFTPPENTEANYAACALLLQTPYDELESIARGIPPDIADAVYPVALVKLGLTAYQIPLDPTMSKTFDQFHTTYGKFIMAAADRNRPRYALSRTFEEAQDEIAASTDRTDLYKEWKDNSPAAADLKQKLAAVKNSQDS